MFPTFYACLWLLCSSHKYSVLAAACLSDGIIFISSCFRCVFTLFVWPESTLAYICWHWIVLKGCRGDEDLGGLLWERNWPATESVGHCFERSSQLVRPSGGEKHVLKWFPELTLFCFLRYMSTVIKSVSKC